MATTSFTNCSRHHKAIKYMCIFDKCAQSNAAICDDCLATTHRHQTQQMASFAPLRAGDRERIEVIRTELASQFNKFKKEMVQIFEGELKQIGRRLEELATNIDIYGGMPHSDLKQTLMHFRFESYEMIKPEEFRRFYQSYRTGELKSQIKPCNIEATSTSLYNQFKYMFAELDEALTRLFDTKVFKTFDPSGQPLLKNLGKSFITYIESAASESQRNLHNRKQESLTKKLMKEAGALQRSGKHQQALIKYNQVIELSPQYFKAYNNKGVVLRDIGRVDEAIRAFTHSIVINPKWTQGFINLGICQRLNLKYLDSYDSLTRALEQKPDSIPAFYNRAITLTSLQRFKNALQDINNALYLNPMDEDLLIFKGICYANMSETKEAIQCYNKVIDQNSSNDQAWYNKGLALKKQDRLREAEECLVRALAQSPGNESYKQKLQTIRREIRLTISI